tara:strand:- start:280 stop:546 length:267 start_codon:yes stop_codon:yes gene_type:complete
LLPTDNYGIITTGHEPHNEKKNKRQFWSRNKQADVPELLFLKMLVEPCASDKTDEHFRREAKGFRNPNRAITTKETSPTKKIVFFGVS